MLEAKIVNTGRVPEIAGTRITVYDVISTRSHAPAGNAVFDAPRL